MPYACARTISALWAINETDNVWVWIDGWGWHKLDMTDTRDLLLVAARAKLDGTIVDLAEELPANIPVPIATAASVKFQPSVKYSSCRLTRS